MATVNLSRDTDEARIELSTDHAASSYGLPVALLDGELVDHTDEIGPGVTIADAVYARATDIVAAQKAGERHSYRLPLIARRMAIAYLQQWPEGPQIQNIA